MDVLHNSINNLAHEYRLVFYHHTALIFHALIFLFLPFSKQFFPLFSLSLFLSLVSLFALSNCCSKNKFSICYHTNIDLDKSLFSFNTMDNHLSFSRYHYCIQNNPLLQATHINIGYVSHKLVPIYFFASKSYLSASHHHHKSGGHNYQ